jgi:uncharacterized protein YndB with AHSA1/START domain
VPSVTRSGVVPVPPEAIWGVISDAYSLPRWWPAVTRVEGISEIGFTEVLYSRRGRPIRLDLLYTEVEEDARLAWRLDIPGGQFERLLSEWSTRFTLVPEAPGTRVTIEERQTFRGVSFKTGGFIQRRAARKRIDGALAGLADLF